MAETRRNVIVGLFVLGGVLALGALILMFGRGPSWLVGTKTYTVYVEFRDAAGQPQAATGVRSGTQVTIWGKEVGRVTSVDFVDARQFGRGVRVELAIDKRFSIPQGSRVETIEPGLGMGRPPLEILPAADGGAILAGGETLPGTMTTAMESLFPPTIVTTIETTARQIGEAAAAMTPVLSDVHEMLRPRTVGEVDTPGGPPGNLATAAARLDSTLKHFNDVLGDAKLKEDVRVAIENVRIITEDGKATVATIRDAADSAKGVVRKAEGFIDQGSATLARISDHADRVVAGALDVLRPTARAADELQRTLTGVNEGKGTLGMLLHDARLYEALVLTVRRLGETVEEARILIKDWQKGKIRVAL